MVDENKQSTETAIDSMPMNEVTIDEIKKYVNEKPLTLWEKNEIINCAKYYLLHLNPNQGIIQSILKLNIEEDLNEISSRAPIISNFDFHQKMIKLFVSVRDFNVKYRCSPAMGEAFGFLGFSISQCFNKEKSAIYVVSQIDDHGLKCDGFDVGSEIISIDGVPVQEYAQKLGKLTYSTNHAAQLKVGLQMTTFRDISEVLEPYPEFTKIKFKNSGSEYTKQLTWKYNMSYTEDAKHDTLNAKKSFRIRYLNEVQISTALFQYKKMSCLAKEGRSKTFLNRIDVCEGLNVLAELHMCQSITFVYFKVWNFRANFEEQSKFELSSSFVQIFNSLPQTGLILDLRGNPGGYLTTVLQFLSFIRGVDEIKLYSTRNASNLLATFYKENKDLLTPSGNAIIQAANIGEQYTAPIEFEIEADKANLQVYHGPVVVLVDAETCSAAELFASIVAYNKLGRVIGVDVATAGSTASIKTSSQLDGDYHNYSLPDDIMIVGPFQKVYVVERLDVDIPEAPIRKGIINDREHVGLQPDERYYLSKDDIMYNDIDLFNHIGCKYFSKGGSKVSSSLYRSDVEETSSEESEEEDSSEEK